MSVRYFALVLGVVYTLIGLLGFIPGMLQPMTGAPDLTVDTGSGLLLGLFPVNLVHTIVHLLIGVWGILAYRSFSQSRTYSRVVAVLFAVLAVMGLVPALSTTFGLIPLFGNDIWLHGLTALVAAYFGWVAPGPTVRAYDEPPRV